MGGKKRLTNDEAIYVLKNTAWLGWSEQAEKVSEAVWMAVEALNNSNDQLNNSNDQLNNSNDDISRQDVIDTLCDWICGVGERCVKTHCQCIRRIEAIPSVDVPDTNVGDMISRQVAISNCKARLYESALNSIGHECQADEVFRDIAEHRIGTWLEELPPVQPEPQWIPVTERLPEDDTVVLCSIPASDGYIERIAFGYYMRFGNLGWRMSDWLQNHGAYGAMQPEPIAWMPLPEPYAERRTDGSD